jgi:hypothetical protein
MMRIMLGLLALFPLCAQELDLDSYLRALKKAPGSSIESKVRSLENRGITLSDSGQRELNRKSNPALSMSLLQGSPRLVSPEGNYLGNLNANRFDVNSVSNPFGRYGSEHSPDSVNNPFGRYGSPYSPQGAQNPYATKSPLVVSPDGKYLGRYSLNTYDPDSISNPYGRFGSPFDSDSVNNLSGKYGSSYSPSGVRNPSTNPPPPANVQLPLHKKQSGSQR